MIDLRAIERAGRTRRWHSNADLCDTSDPVSHHAGRVARIICALWPDASAALLRAALIHDDGEAGAWGDVPYDAKRDMPPAMRAEMNEAEDDAIFALWGEPPFLSESENRLLKFADRLDAYMWAQRHRPDILDRDGWPEDRAWLVANAIAMGVSGPVCAVIEGEA